VSLSAADGVIAESELAALSKIAFERGIAFDRMQVMLSKANEYQYLIPQNMIDREKQLHDMIQFAQVDGNFCKAEMDLITLVAERLGFSKGDLEKIIEGMK
jgi:hypothetical protein